MQESKTELVCADGTPLAASLFHDPENTSPKGVVVIASALGVARAFYKKFATWLAGQGYSVLTYDNRGIADSMTREIVAAKPRLADWGYQDLTAALDHAATLPGGQNIHILGHSVGGQILGLASGLDRVKSVMFVASSLPWLGWFKGSDWLKMSLSFRITMPLLARFYTIFPVKATGLSNINFPSTIIKDWADWIACRNYVLEPKFGHSRDGYQAATMPLLGMAFSDDLSYVPEPAFDAVLDCYPNAHINRRWVDVAAEKLGKVGHFGFFRPEREADLWQEATIWFDRHAA